MSARPAAPGKGLVRISYDETRTSADVAREVAARGGAVDTVSDLYGIMLVDIEDAERLRDIPGLRSLSRLRLNPNW